MKCKKHTWTPLYAKPRDTRGFLTYYMRRYNDYYVCLGCGAVATLTRGHQKSTRRFRYRVINKSYWEQEKQEANKWNLYTDKIDVSARNP